MSRLIQGQIRRWYADSMSSPERYSGFHEVFSSRCLVSTCRGIYFDAGICKNLYDIEDVPETNRNQYNPVSLTSSVGNFLVNGKDSG